MTRLLTRNGKLVTRNGKSITVAVGEAESCECCAPAPESCGGGCLMPGRLNVSWIANVVTCAVPGSEVFNGAGGPWTSFSTTVDFLRRFTAAGEEWCEWKSPPISVDYGSCDACAGITADITFRLQRNTVVPTNWRLTWFDEPTGAATDLTPNNEVTGTWNCTTQEVTLPVSLGNLIRDARFGTTCPGACSASKCYQIQSPGVLVTG
jgi:hypothetical protein